jgi:hypothetical protein
MDTFVDEGRDGFWDPNPRRGWRQRSSSLTLFTYAILLRLEAALREFDGQQLHTETKALTQWLDARRKRITCHIDHCLHRDLDDHESDGPWDHVVTDRAGLECPTDITYFDWPTSALLALRLSRATKRYDHSDALREQHLNSRLSGRADQFHRWYSFRLSMVVIAAASSGPLYRV